MSGALILPSAIAGAGEIDNSEAATAILINFFIGQLPIVESVRIMFTRLINA